MYERYEAIVRLHVAPALGAVPLAKLRPLHLQRLYSQLQAGGMSAAGVGKVHARLHFCPAAGRALAESPPYNPADGVESPRVERRHVRVLSETETAPPAICGDGKPPLCSAYRLAVSTGMRRGELLGLRWRDVDLEGGALSVAQALEETRALALVPRHRRRRTAVGAWHCRPRRWPSCASIARARRLSGCVAVRPTRTTIWSSRVRNGPPWRPSAFFDGVREDGAQVRSAARCVRTTCVTPTPRSSCALASIQRWCRNAWGMQASPRPLTSTGRHARLAGGGCAAADAAICRFFGGSLAGGRFSGVGYQNGDQMRIRR